jgi:hypothetical protein
MNINNKTLHEFGNDLRDALAPLEDKYGVTIRFGNISYTEERFTTKLTVTNGQNIEDVERCSFDADVWKFGHLGLERGMFNRVFLTPDGQKLAIRGFNTRSSKYPIIALRISDGQRLRCAPDHIAQLTDEYYQPNTRTDEGITASKTTSSAEVSTPQAESIQPDLNSLIEEIARSEQETPFEKQFWEKMTTPGVNGEQALRELYRQLKKPAPNDPCPCGSGKKYKKCCGR